MSSLPVIAAIYGLGLCAALAVVYQLMPRLTRPDIYFGVTVAAGFRVEPPALAALRRYRSWVWLHTVISVVIVLVGTRTHHELFFAMSAVLWQTLGSMQALLSARRAVLPFATAPTMMREATLAARPLSLPGGVLLQAAPFVILTVAALYLRVFGLPAMGLAICASVLLSSYAILHRSRRIRTTGDHGDRERKFRSTMLAILLAVEYLVALTFVVTAWSPAMTASPLWLIGELLVVISIVIVAARLGQGGTRLASTVDTWTKPVGDRTADSLWKWGLFYCNPDDPALFVEKRFGIGYTLNLGSRWSWVILLLMFVIPVASTLLALR